MNKWSKENEPLLYESLSGFKKTPADFRKVVEKAAAHARFASDGHDKPKSMAVMWNEKYSRWELYKATAWTKPTSDPMMPWSPPPYEAFAIILPDENWTKGPAYSF